MQMASERVQFFVLHFVYYHFCGNFSRTMNISVPNAPDKKITTFHPYVEPNLIRFM